MTLFAFLWIKANIRMLLHTTLHCKCKCKWCSKTIKINISMTRTELLMQFLGISASFETLLIQACCVLLQDRFWCPPLEPRPHYRPVYVLLDFKYAFDLNIKQIVLHQLQGCNSFRFWRKSVFFFFFFFLQFATDGTSGFFSNYGQKIIFLNVIKKVVNLMCLYFRNRCFPGKLFSPVCVSTGCSCVPCMILCQKFAPEKWTLNSKIFCKFSWFCSWLLKVLFKSFV